MSKTKIITLQNKIVGTNDSGKQCMLITTPNTTSSPRIKNIAYNLIKQSNILSNKKTVKITFTPDSNIISMSQPVLEVPYGSTLSYNGNTFIATSPNNIQYSSTANCKNSYDVGSWGNFPTGAILSNVVIKVTSKQSTIPVTIAAEYGTVTATKVFVLKDSTYSISGNTLTIRDINGTMNTITYTPNNTGEDTYYIYRDAVWNNISSSGTISTPIDISVTQNKTEKTYTCDLSWGQNNPEVNPEEISGWDNGGNISGISLLADHTYVLHREDSAGISVSYLGLVNADGSHTIIEPYTVNTDVIFTGVAYFYFGDVVNDEEFSGTRYCEDLTEKTTTSINYFFKPGDYIRDNGNQTIKINVHRRQSCCWHTLRSGSWKRTNITNSAGKSVTGPSSKKSDDFTWNLDGVVANRPVYMYIGFGSVASTTTTGHATDSKPWDWIGDGGCSWTITGESTGKIHTHYNAGTRATLLYTWWRWVFQRLY